MTAEGAEKLKEELDNLKHNERPKIAQAIKEAREKGDLKENAEYHAAREQQSFAEGRIKDIEAKLSNAQIIDIKNIPASSRVIFGTTVDLIDLGKTGEHKKIDFPRWEEQRLFERFKTFIKDLPQILFEACLAKLTTLIQYFIPPEIPIPFTLCTFLSVLGFPKQIDVVELALDGA